jgi:hypothetical protein
MAITVLAVIANGKQIIQAGSWVSSLVFLHDAAAKITAPPAWDIGAVVAMGLLLWWIWHELPSRSPVAPRRDRPVESSPLASTLVEATLSHSETLILHGAVSELSKLTWAQQTGLCLIYGRAPLHQGVLKSQLEALGLASVFELIINPLKMTTLIDYDMHSVRFGPSNNAIIARHVETWTQSLKRL